MIRVVIIILAAMALAPSAMAKDKVDAHQHENHKDHKHPGAEASIKQSSPESMLIQVKGMVCAFCAQGIEKNFNSKDEVESTKVDLDKMEVFIKFKPGKSLSVEQIKEVVTGAGFAFVGVKK